MFILPSQGASAAWDDAVGWLSVGSRSDRRTSATAFATRSVDGQMYVVDRRTAAWRLCARGYLSRRLARLWIVAPLLHIPFAAFAGDVPADRGLVGIGCGRAGVRRCTVQITSRERS